ncbi:hypothetical protein CR513_56414, partial [Mucuna pruriens]
MMLGTKTCLMLCLEKVGASNLNIIVSEGGDGATNANAATYYYHLIIHAWSSTGTPKIRSQIFIPLVAHYMVQVVKIFSA